MPLYNSLESKKRDQKAQTLYKSREYKNQLKKKIEKQDAQIKAFLKDETQIR